MRFLLLAIFVAGCADSYAHEVDAEMPRVRAPMSTLGTDQSQFSSSAFAKLHNLAMREPGMVEPLPGRAVIAENIEANYAVRRLWPVKDIGASTRELALLKNVTSGVISLRAIEAASSSAIGYFWSSITEPCGATEARGRGFFAATPSVMVIENDADDGRTLGVVQPTWLAIASKTTTDAQAVPATSRVAWRATIHRQRNDGYEIFSAPSYAMYGESGGAVTDFTIRVGWPDGYGEARIEAGDTVKLWRARAVTAGTATNDRYLLTAEVVTTSADITNRYVEIRDVTPDAALASGEELYTNPGQQGALQANWQVGPSADVAIYNGHAFYAQRSLPAFVERRIPSRFGAVSGTARAAGIGRRGFVGDAALGNPTVTAISAANMVGLVAGQILFAAVGGEFAVGIKILSVNAGAGTVTFDANAIAAGVGAFFEVIDTVTVNSEELRANNLATLVYDAWLNNLRVIFTFNELVDGEGLTTSFVPTSSPYIEGLSIRIDMIAPEGVLATDLAITATNGQNYSPAITGTLNGEIDERLNRAQWSKLDQPEHVPAVNELTIGKDEIVRMFSTQDRLFFLCTDGAYAVTGSAPNWSVDRVDENLIIASQAAADGMNGNVYVYAKDRGLLRITRGGAIEGLTKGAVQRAMIDSIDTADTGDGYEAHVVCDALHDECGVFFVGIAGGV